MLSIKIVITVTKEKKSTAFVAKDHSNPVKKVASGAFKLLMIQLAVEWFNKVVALISTFLS